MKKPDRKEFTREFGARAAAKYATAMRKYRKYLKQKPQPKPKAKSEAARIATAMKREVSTRQSQKVTDAMKRVAASARSSTKGKPAASKPEPQPKPDSKAKDNRSRNPEAVAARAKRERIMNEYPATAVYRIAADSKKAKAALDAKYGGKQPDKPKTRSIPVKNRRGRTTGTKEVPVTPKNNKTPKARYNRRGRRF